MKIDKPTTSGEAQRCPTCGSEDPTYVGADQNDIPCRNKWHAAPVSPAPQYEGIEAGSTYYNCHPVLGAIRPETKAVPTRCKAGYYHDSKEDAELCDREIAEALGHVPQPETPLCEKCDQPMEPRGSQFPGYQWFCPNPACTEFGPETPGAEQHFTTWQDLAEKLRQELEAKDEALQEIINMCPYTDAGSRIACVARAALKEPRQK
jgi:hypothetical protein